MTDSSAFVEKTFLRREREFSVFPYFNGRNFSGYRYEQKERKKKLSWRQNILPDILRCRLQEKIAAYLRLIVSQRKERNTQRYCSFYWKNYAFFRHHVSFSLVKEGYFLKRYLAHFYVVGTQQHFPPQIKCISFAVRNDVLSLWISMERWYM